MLAMQSYEQANGFAVMDADELYYINAGSGATVTISGTVTTDSTGKTTGSGAIVVSIPLGGSSGSSGSGGSGK
jgi:hypothetical protein